MFVLTNQESQLAVSSILHWVVDHYLGVSDTDWLKVFQELAQQAKQENELADAKSSAARIPGTRPSLPLENYAQPYHDAWYGDIEITLGADGILAIQFGRTPDLIGDLEHWHHDTFVVRWRKRELKADAFITFSLNADATIERAKMKAVSTATDSSYDFHDLVIVPNADQK